MNKSLRIKVNPVEEANKYIQVRLDQDIDSLEILSLKIGQTDIYSAFNADYGVLVGRVIANGGIGIPNAKISVFIPISEEDKLRSEITAIYPYETVRDKDQEGRKYNLLPRVSVNNPFLVAGTYSPKVPVGSFPTKEEIYTNPSYLEVYQKYYKYTTVTNASGDYMIYGVPVGVHDVHMSVDITDIGQFSMSPSTMVSQLGYSENLFTANGSKIKYSTDLDILPNVETQNIAVNIRPFWGDGNNYEIGITRQDFKIRATLVASFTIFGAGFTDGHDSSWGMDSYYGDGDRDDSSSAMSKNPSEEFNNNTAGTEFNLGIASKRNGEFKIEVYTIPNEISDADIAAGNFDTAQDIVLLAENSYGKILENGQFILTLPCNRRKKVTNEEGILVDTDDDDPNGIFTEFVGMMIFEYGHELTMRNAKSSSERNRADRVRIKFPQSATFNQTFSSEREIAAQPTFPLPPFVEDPPSSANRLIYNEQWRKQNYRFSAGKIYSVAKLNGTSFEDEGARLQIYNESTRNPFKNAGAIIISSTDDVDQGFVNNALTTLDITGNAGTLNKTNVKTFAAEWLNFCIYFPQIYNYTSGSFDVTRLLTNDYNDHTNMTISNTYLVVGTRRDTSYFLRSDLSHTDFVEVPLTDLVNIVQNAPNIKGFKTTDAIFQTNTLTGSYKGVGSVKYFYRGIYTADCIKFLLDNGIISV